MMPTYRAFSGPPPIPTPVYPPAPTGQQGSLDDYDKQLMEQTRLALPVDIGDDLRKKLLAQQGSLSGQFADRAQAGYNAYGQQAQGALAALQRQASGQDSISAEQLRQSLGQQLSQQRSFAAGASPRNAAGAARTAAIQMGRASTAMAGQQATAGLQERQQANQQYLAGVTGLRSQDLNASLQSRSLAESGYGAGMTGAPPPVTDYTPMIIGGAAALAASDRRLKTDLGPGDDKANAAIDALRPYAYRYRDPQAYGAGPQLGTTTQDLSRAGLGQAVVKTSAGEMVDPGKLSGANTAMIAALGRRVQELEGGKKSERMNFVNVFDPEAADAQGALDRRRVQLDDLGRGRSADGAANTAQEALNRRRAALAALARQASLAGSE